MTETGRSSSIKRQETILNDIKEDNGNEEHNGGVPEIGLFYTLNCDIKASDDMIKRKYLERTHEIVVGHLL